MQLLLGSCALANRRESLILNGWQELQKLSSDTSLKVLTFPCTEETGFQIFTLFAVYAPRTLKEYCSPNLNTEMWRILFFPTALIVKALLDFYSYSHFARGAVKDIPESMCTWKTACTGSFYLFFFFFSSEDTEQCFIVNGDIRSYYCELLVRAVRLVISTSTGAISLHKA